MCGARARRSPDLQSEYPVIEFSDRAEFAGVADSGRNEGAAFGDYDGDGWPDLLVAAEAGAEALLYRNTEDGRFEHQPGALAESSRALGALFVDLESDGDLVGSPVEGMGQ